MQNLQNELINILQHEDALVVEGQLNKNKIVEMALQVDPKLIKHLINHDTFKTHFFTDVEGVLVFDKIKFQRFVNNKSVLPDSYTAFKNKIGLTINDGTTDNYITTKNDVVLAWPHKDCVLEGGQTKEDQKRNEILWNETLTSYERYRLLDPKVFTNWKKYDQQGEHEVTEISDNDNLIIKGNNLLALASLKKCFKNRVKLIYIDPPYNTGSDSFQYNDSFNHSSWLTFMKNRLEIAKNLLVKDGKIFIQCDDNEQAYLKILMDEVFKQQNFVETFVWKNTDNAPTLSKKTRKNLEFIHCYEKVLDTSKGYVGRDSDNDDAPLLNSGNPITVLEFKPEIIQFRIPDGNYPKGSYDKVELLDDLVVKKGKNENKIRLKGRFKWQQSFLDTEVSNGTYFLIKSNKFSIRYQREIASNMAPDKLIDEIYLSKAMGVETNEDSKKHIDSLNLNFNSYPKPESLIGFLIRAVTEEGDIVLDYHLGSGTTAATAHKMNRQYIGIEQMDYIETVAVERLKKVIEGEQGGISKSVNWQGGGSFIYLELKKYNQIFIEQIQEAKNTEELLKIWEQMKEKSFLNYNVDIQKQEAHIEEFKTLTLAEQKQHLVEILDKNQLYVNLSALDDKDFACTEEEKKVTQDFYGRK